MPQSEIRGVIFDVDGVLEFQGSVLPGAIETVAALRARGIVIRFLTNSTLKSRASCAALLVEAGFEAFPDEVITASSATAVYLKTLRPRSCWTPIPPARKSHWAASPEARRPAH